VEGMSARLGSMRLESTQTVLERAVKVQTPQVSPQGSPEGGGSEAASRSPSKSLEDTLPGHFDYLSSELVLQGDNSSLPQRLQKACDYGEVLGRHARGLEDRCEALQGMANEMERDRQEGEGQLHEEWSEQQGQALARCRAAERQVEEMQLRMQDKDAQFEQFKNVIKEDLEAKCKQIIALEVRYNEEREKNQLLSTQGNHDLLQARNTMSMARRLRTQESEIVSLGKAKREIEQQKSTQLKMLEVRDARIKQLSERNEELTKKLDEAKIAAKAPPAVQGSHSPPQRLGAGSSAGGLRLAKPLRGGGRKATRNPESPLKLQCDEAEDQWKSARMVARAGVRSPNSNS